ncbi:hypothetical protein AAFF_G00171670 [Aldrovandia affinis]|uniref:Uncharacterized protein n=1 Tax=Aldrovandia affinis TaxID=143900 RepID=A0AAD7WVJ7_9TELE|nr:hypothetical protein AAFF_G00171670 [Aldrovandia affinis]
MSATHRVFMPQQREPGMAFGSRHSEAMTKFNNNVAGVVNKFEGNMIVWLMITQMTTMCFLVIPECMVNLIDGAYAVAVDYPGEDFKELSSRYNRVYINSGIVTVVVGCLAMCVNIVLSYFVVLAKKKLLTKSNGSMTTGRSTVGVVLYVLAMNAQLLFSVLRACMELLYRSLTMDGTRIRHVETAIASFGLMVVIAGLITGISTTMLLMSHEESQQKTQQQQQYQLTGQAPYQSVNTVYQQKHM